MRGAGPPKLLRICVSNKCNLDCVFCCWNRNVPATTILNPSDYKFIAETVIKNNHYRRIMLTGGEPLLLDDTQLLPVVESIEQLRGKNLEDFWICSNGILLKQKAKDLAIAGLQQINITLAANTPNSYSKYTRSLFSLDLVLNGISEAARFGINVRVDVPIFRTGVTEFNEISELIRLVENAGARSLCYFRLHESENNADVFRDLYSPVDHITLSFQQNELWCPVLMHDGRLRMFNQSGFMVIIPGEIKKVTKNCLTRTCRTRCQGTYAAYIEGTTLRFCHNLLPDRANEYDISTIVRRRDTDALSCAISKSLSWA